MNVARPEPDRRPLPAALWLAGLALWLLCTIGLRPLLNPDEGRYAGVARAMLISGQGWLVPQLNGLPFFHKPPLMYWLDAAAMAVFGIHPWAARFAPAVGAWVMAAALFLAMRRWHGERPALAALGLIATTPLFFLGGQYANHDMLVAGFITAAILAFAEALRDGTAAPQRWLQVGWLCCGLALLAKGLIGVVLPLAVVLPWAVGRRRWGVLAQGLHPLSWLPGLMLAAPWFIAMQLRFPDFFDYFVVEQHFRRFTQTNFNNAQPFWFFFAVLPLLTLPWTAVALPGLRRLRAAAGPWFGLHAWWIVVIVGFFSLPHSKLVGYVLPAVAPWCALLSLCIAPASRAWRWTVAGSAVLGVALVLLLVGHTPRSTRDLGETLARHRAAGDPVVFVDEMFYDLPFYAGLDEPPIVASDWTDPAIATHDNWRKELADAGRFDQAAAARVLWPIGRLPALLCRPGATVWFVTAGAHRPDGLAPLPGLTQVAAGRDATLWNAPGHACP